MKHKAKEVLFAETGLNCSEVLESLLEKIPATLYTAATDDIRKTILVSDEVVSSLGYSREEWLSDPALWSKRLHADDRGRVLAEFAESRRTGKPFRSEYRLQSRRGSDIWFHDKATIGRGSNGSSRVHYGVMVDATWQKKSEDVMVRLRKAIDRSRDVIFMTDGAGKITFVNPEFCQLYGYEMEEAIGRTPRILKSGVQSQDEYGKFWLTISGGSTFKGEFINKTKYGRLVNMEVTVDPLIDAEGSLSGFISIQRDVTDRKRGEGALRASEERFRGFFEQATVGIYRTTPEGKIVLANPALVRMLGFSGPDDLAGRNLEEEGFDPSHARRLFRERVEWEGEMRGFETMWKRKDGSVISVRESSKAFRGADGEVLYYEGTVEDVTERHHLQQLLQAQKLESIGTLAGGIAHDFNNILGIVLGNLALLERTKENDILFRQSVTSVQRAVERGASLVRQILTFARKSEPSREPVNVNAAIQELGKMLEETFPKTISLSLWFEKSIPVLSLDPTQLHQALLNLCINARDAMNGQGELVVSTQLVPGSEISGRFSEGRSDHYVKISVADTGSGMDEATRKRIFEPFFSTKEKGKGTGLGLAVVYGVVDNHHGFVDVESAPGKGTIFEIYLPVPEELVTLKQMEGGRKSGALAGDETILVVEDEPLLRDLLVRFLEDAGYSVIAAADGDEAVQKFYARKDEIDLVLSDIGLPKQSGWESFLKMKKTSAHVRALLASGYIDPTERSKILASGVNGIISKPYRVEEILGTIRETLDSMTNAASDRPT